MRSRSRRSPLLTTLFCVSMTPGLFCAPNPLSPAGALATQEGEQAVDTPETFTVALADLHLRMVRDGRIESAATHRLSFDFEAYSGKLEVAEVGKVMGAVREGDFLMRLTAVDWEQAIRAAEENLSDSRQRLAWAEQELKLNTERQVTDLEQAENSLKDALTDLMLWEKYRAPNAQRATELNLLQSQYGLDDQRQELEQLEDMYRNTSLATETKDIVLDRARRSLKVSEQWFESTRNNHVVAKEFEFPRQDRNARDAARYAQQSYDHTLVRQRIGMEQQQQQVTAARRALRVAEEHMAELRRDEEALIMKAPASGLMSRITPRVGDRIGGGQQVAEIHDVSQLNLSFASEIADSRIISEGSQVDVHFASLPEVDCSARITMISPIAGGPLDKTEASSGSLDVLANLESTDPMIRPGMACRVVAQRTLTGVPVVPNEFLVREDHGAHVFIMAGGNRQQRAVRLGATDGSRTHVLDGLAAGDVIVKP